MPTIADVAKACGISKATVSLVMNNSSLKVSRETRAKVLRVAKEMNYQPSASARSLSLQRSNMIGIVTQRNFHMIADAYYGQLINAIIDSATCADYTVSLYNGRIWRDAAETQCIFGDGRCDGVIVLMAKRDERLTAALHQCRVPFVTVNSGIRTPDVNSIDIDNVDAGYRMTRYLLDCGHRRIACLRTHDQFSVDRRDGYRKALADAGIDYAERLDIVSAYSADDNGFIGAQRIFSQPEHGVTAIFAATDRLAVEAIHGLKDLGLRVPADVSVVGLNDTPDAALCRPPLTTLRQSVDSIGEEAMRLLADLIRNPYQSARQLIWPTQLVIRESTAPPATDAQSATAREPLRTSEKES
jgi:LacI family transcriptional regulator